MARDLTDVVGLSEIAEKLAVRTETAVQWRARAVLPEPDAMIAGRTPVWSWSASIAPWAVKTGRLDAAKAAPAEDSGVEAVIVDIPSDEYQQLIRSVEQLRGQCVTLLDAWLAKQSE